MSTTSTPSLTKNPIKKPSDSDESPSHDLPSSTGPAQVCSSMGFIKPKDVIADTERPGLLRASPEHLDGRVNDLFDFPKLTINDCLAPSASPLNLESMGFDTIDLSLNEKAQSIFKQIHLDNRLSSSNAKALRRNLNLSGYRLSNGKTLRLLYIAPDGLIMRKAGPNGLKVEPNEKLTGTNGHDGAVTVHGDQDVYGTPLKQIMRGAAPYLFRHNTPDGSNKRSPFFLLNIWVPLQQITRPLSLMDRQTLDQKKHQLRYALPVTSFLEREQAQSANDIWTFLHSPEQQWHFHSEMNSNKAYVFDTLGMAHGAFCIPGEEVAEHYYLKLQSALKALSDKEMTIFQKTCKNHPIDLPSDITLPLKAAIKNMENLLGVGYQAGESISAIKSNWIARTELAMDAVIRKSIEMRVVCLVL